MTLRLALRASDIPVIGQYQKRRRPDWPTCVWEIDRKRPKKKELPVLHN